MTHSQATPAEHQALTTTALALAILTNTWTPGTITALATATLTYLLAITLGAWALRWNIPHTVTATSLHLRLTTATTLLAIALATQTAATGITWLLNTAANATTPTTTHLVDTNINA